MCMIVSPTPLVNPNDIPRVASPLAIELNSPSRPELRAFSARFISGAKTMTYFVGLDVSLKKTSVCIVDDKGTVLKEKKIDTDPETIGLFLFEQFDEYELVGLEAGQLSQWLYAGLARAGLPVVVMETRHAKKMLTAQINKNDRNDARGLAHMVRTGMYVPVHVKTVESQRLRVLLTARKLAQSKQKDIEISIRGMIRNFGLKMGVVTRAGWDARVRELVVDEPMLASCIEPLLECRRVLREKYIEIHKLMLAFVRQDDVCRLLMTCPGVGPYVALSYKTAIDIPQRFKRSKSVGAHLGMTPRQYQSGEVDINGRISKCGDREVRTALVEAAMTIMVNVKRDFPLKDWALRLQQSKKIHKAAVALARRLAVILHRMWTDWTEFRWDTGAQPVLIAAA